ncbi:glycosyltransferase family 2 protein [Sphingomonas jatrophae]|uniref:Glycosyltransferase involved in cell wall bisynthesis n=1 Tax=Sphingomonas jatrophae TaxID=1166337 RepID=A0A1I6JT40_9SPHN|nr:glycosyltransferase family 2 protein [Sphingomonas jatrophae]SFR81710.1 Glycosyltransferase involved in cell wall bisynthesis [Sphingomonas jatrophae]
MSQADPVFSVVIPTRNEEENALPIAAAVIGEMERIGDTFELIFIDNHSDDRTVELLKDLCARDPRVKLIVNARNFGQMRSPTHGIYQARGRAVINMCADFQDPPELLPRFVERWRSGFDIVLGVRQSEKSSVQLGLVRRFSYWAAATFGDYPIIPNATGFGLYDRRVVQAVAKIQEPEPFFRGMLVETGYSVDTISYIRPERAGGVSNNNFFALLEFALSSLAGMSKRLLRVPLHIGALMLMASLLLLVAGIVAGVLGGRVWPWIVGAIAQAQVGGLFIFLGLMGDQIRLISERTRRTPLVIERERINFTDEA